MAATMTVNPTRASVAPIRSASVGHDTSAQKKRVKPSVCEVAMTLPKAQWGNLGKIVYTAIDWANKASVISPPYAATATAVHTVGKDVKLFSGLLELLPKTFTAAKSWGDVAKNPTAKKVGRAALDTVSVISPAHDTLELYQRVALRAQAAGAKLGNLPKPPPLASHVVTTLAKINFAALAVSMTHGAVEAIGNIANSGLEKAKTPEERSVAKNKISLSVINLIKSVAYVALAAVGLLFLFGAVAMTPVVSILMLSFSTVSLVATFWSYFHESIHDPYGKKKV